MSGTLNARWFHVSDYNLGKSGDLYGGENDLIYCDDATAGKICRVTPWTRLFGTSAIPVVWRRRFGKLGGPDSDATLWSLRRVVFEVSTDAVANIAFTLKVWELGENPTDLPGADPIVRSIYTKNLVYTVGHWTNAPRLLTFDVENSCRWPELELSASIQSDLRVKLVQLQYSSHGDTPTE
jgi:hypothetical protein